MNTYVLRYKDKSVQTYNPWIKVFSYNPYNSCHSSTRLLASSHFPHSLSGLPTIHTYHQLSCSSRAPKIIISHSPLRLVSTRTAQTALPFRSRPFSSFLWIIVQFGILTCVSSIVYHCYYHPLLIKIQALDFITACAGLFPHM